MWLRTLWPQGPFGSSRALWSFQFKRNVAARFANLNFIITGTWSVNILEVTKKTRSQMGSWTWVRCVQACEILVQGKRIKVIESGGGDLWISTLGLVWESKAKFRSKLEMKADIFGKWYHMVFPLIWQKEVVGQWQVGAVSLYSPKPFPWVFHPAWIQLELSTLFVQKPVSYQCSDAEGLLVTASAENWLILPCVILLQW